MPKRTNNVPWDVIVIGGGPAGMMAAGRAGERGRSVLLVEKNNNLGKKLLITGGGRCNITNNKPTVRALINQYRGNPKFLFSAFTQFGVAETLVFFNSRGMPTNLEAEDRVFPASNKARSVLDVLVAYLKTNSVRITTGTEIKSIRHDAANSFFVLKTKNKETLIARTIILATGGKARPETGSTGDGFTWLKKLGHSVVENSMALVPIAVQDAWVKKLAGVTLRGVRLSIVQNDRIIESKHGKILFTHFGVSGPTILNMSKRIGEHLQQGPVTLLLDLFPEADDAFVKARLQNLLVEQSNKKLKNTLANFIAPSLVTAVLAIAGVDGETFNHSVRHEDRIVIAKICKKIPLTVSGLLGKDKAVVSSGGVSPLEVDFKTMQSKITPGLYVVGDVLDIDRPSGGYSLQLAWTTGFLAGNNA